MGDDYPFFRFPSALQTFRGPISRNHLLLALLCVLLLFGTPLNTSAYELPLSSVIRADDMDDLWVDAVNGDDANDGRTADTSFRTIQKAADLAEPGTTVHILPGVYRETVQPAMSGSATEPILYVAENGPDTVVIRGSEPTSSLNWTQLTNNTIGLPSRVDPSNIYYADLSTWEIDAPPRFVVQLDDLGHVASRLPLAREPDWQVTTEWKYHEFWWAADGGWDVAGCDPPTDPDPEDCDLPWRSSTQLTDRTNDSDPPGVEPGNLTTLGNLTGAVLVVMDCGSGHYVYRRTINVHEITAGRVTVDSVSKDLGWGSKYYVEGKPRLLDNPGEWWYDVSTDRLYLWPPIPNNPAMLNIEISQRDNGFILTDRSYITLDNLSLEFFNASAIRQYNNGSKKSYDNIVRRTTIRYADYGILLFQGADGPAENITDGFTIENSEIAYIDTNAIYTNYWWEDQSAADSFTHAGVINTVIRNNELHHIGFHTGGVGASFWKVDKMHFENNYVHHVAHNGIQFSKSVIQSSKEYGFSPDEIKTGTILIKDNVFEKACQVVDDCGALKIWGDPPDNHVFRDMLITGNIFRDTFGWTYIADKRGDWTYGSVRGMGGFGLYVDMASGIHVYRNIAYNNAQSGFRLVGVWRDGKIVYYNNVVANSLYGFYFGGGKYDTHGSVNTQVDNNIIVNNEGYGIAQEDADGLYANMTFDHNLYYGNGWGSDIWKPGAMAIYRGPSPNEYYQTLAEIQANTPWEDHGVAGDPRFWSYNLDDHDPYDGSWPDFHLTANSTNAIDRGTDSLPTSLTTLLTFFGIDDSRLGTTFDIGRYEKEGFAVMIVPPRQVVNPGGIAHYTLSLHPPDLPYTVSLTATSPSPDLILQLEPKILSLSAQATLAVTDTHTGSSLLPGLWYNLTITGTDDSFSYTTIVGLLVGGRRLYLPVIMKD